MELGRLQPERMRRVADTERGQDDRRDNRQRRSGAGAPDDGLEHATGQRQWSHRASSVRRHLAAFPPAGGAADAENSALFALSLATSSSNEAVRMILLNCAR